MGFPYGEWLIFSLALVAWLERRPSRGFFLLLVVAWLIGKSIEVLIPGTIPWTWHFARLAVMLVFWRWAWQRSECRILPLLFTSLVLSLETLFIVNQPGVIPYEAWLFTIIAAFVAWLTTRSYWGTAAAFTGSLLLNQLFMRLAYEGIVSHANFPDPFIWNFGVGFFAVWAGLRLGRHYYSERAQGVKVYETTEDKELL